MQGYGPTSFGELNADEYDDLHDPGTTDAAVELIADVAGSGSVLELAIGTGRIALPLAARGFAVSGIEASPQMVDKLRAKPGGADIPVVIGDMVDAAIDGVFDTAILVFNTLFNLTSQDAQVRCFANTAARLRPGGVFLVETFVPDFSSYSDNQRVRTMRLDMGSVWLEAARHDPVTQLIEFQRIRITGDGMELKPLPMRYAWPQEMDLMAQLAGLRLRDRWGGWHREPFDAASPMHVSVYEKPAR